jgi:hypothetical protein
MSHFAPIVFTTLLLLGAPIRAQEATTSKYRVEIDSKLVMKLGGETTNVLAKTRLDYANRQKDRSLTVLLNEMTVKTVVNGVAQMNVEMSAKRLRSQEAGGWTETTIDKATPELKAMLQDSFDQPICNIVLDGDDKEVERTMVAKDGAQSVIFNGGLANARLFHPRFAGAEQAWTFPRRMSMGQNQYAVGDLRYEKLPAPPDAKPNGLVQVRVSGTLRNAGFNNGPVRMTNVAYIVTGTQVYDATNRVWVSGKLEFRVSYDIGVPGGGKGIATGTMSVTLAGRG